jgi:hypothetical protein
MLLALKEPRPAQQLETLIDPDEELGRMQAHLYRPELSAFDLPRDGAKLTRRIQLCCDATSRFRFDRRCKSLHPFMISVIDCRSRKFHYENPIVGTRGILCPCNPGYCRKLGRACWQVRKTTTRKTHVSLVATKRQVPKVAGRSFEPHVAGSLTDFRQTMV